MAASSKKHRRTRPRKSQQLGIIAEELNDVEVIDELTRKIVKEEAYSISKFVGHGCGKLRRKCRSWAEILLKKGCEILIVIHDLDRNEESALRSDLESFLEGIAFTNAIVLIPIEELEAWLLSDAKAIKEVFNLRALPKTPRAPEKIASPKEALAKLVNKESKAQYLNTVHNRRIARVMSLDSLKCCPSFSTYPRFLDVAFPNRSKV